MLQPEWVIRHGTKQSAADIGLDFSIYTKEFNVFPWIAAPLKDIFFLSKHFLKIINLVLNTPSSLCMLITVLLPCGVIYLFKQIHSFRSQPEIYIPCWASPILFTTRCQLTVLKLISKTRLLKYIPFPFQSIFTHKCLLKISPQGNSIMFLGCVWVFFLTNWQIYLS